MQIANAMRAVVRNVPEEAIEAVSALDFKNELRAAHFIGQLAHESKFHPISENLRYRASRLMQVWPSRFRTMERARQFAGNQIALANEVYNGRMGNRKDSMDGWNYRGRGFIQITGRNNYTAAKKAIGIDIVKDPDLALQPEVAAKIAEWYFTSNNIWPFCDADNVEKVVPRHDALFDNLKFLQHVGIQRPA